MEVVHRRRMYSSVVESAAVYMRNEEVKVNYIRFMVVDNTDLFDVKFVSVLLMSRSSGGCLLWKADLMNIFTSLLLLM